jgi:hypothetical protein
MAYRDFRLVSMPEDCFGDTYIELREVGYDNNDAPFTHGAVYVGSDTVEGVRLVMAMHEKALSKPVLTEEDFVGFYDMTKHKE